MRRKHRRAAVADVGLDVPGELRDPGHRVWHRQADYHRFMRQRGWSMPAAERMGVATSPANRRSAAAAAWAVATGVATRTPGYGSHRHADWNRLRELGLCG